MENSSANIVLEDGFHMTGQSIGVKGEVCGEMVFNTSMTGYQEILTDPSYYDQILVMTYPLIGNYGVNPNDMQSERVQVKALIVKECSPYYSHYQATQSLSEFLIDHNIVAVEGVDTRKITRHLRTHGAMKGMISTQNTPAKELLKKISSYPNMSGKSLVKEVTTSTIKFIPSSTKKKWNISILDCGVKKNIIQILNDHGCDVHLFPANTSAKKLLEKDSDGILISNGPGDPKPLTEIVTTIQDLLGKKPLLGICLGHQLISMALGLKTYKLKFGHRGANHPIQNSLNKQVSISSQNHGFCVSHDKNINKNILWTHWNLNDNTVAGISHKKHSLLSVQYHPEAAPGPKENGIIFQQFIEMIKLFQKNNTSLPKEKGKRKNA